MAQNPYGHYYRDGDPIGTVRIWNGQEWIGEPQQPSHKPLAAQAKVATLGLALAALASCAAILVRGRDINRLRDASDLGFDLFDERRKAADIAEQIDLVANVRAVMILVTAVAFLFWFHRAFSNLPAMGVSPKRSPSMAVWGWLIPIVNLYAPFSMTKSLTAADESLKRSTRWLIPVWWGLYVAGDLGELVLLSVWTRLAERPLLLSYLNIATLTLDVIAAILAIALVSRITTSHDSHLSST